MDCHDRSSEGGVRSDIRDVFHILSSFCVMERLRKCLGGFVGRHVSGSTNCRINRLDDGEYGRLC